MNHPVVFVDVDDTLIRTVGAKRIPMPQSIAQVKQLHAEGVSLYLWSSGGADYARRSGVIVSFLQIDTVALSGALTAQPDARADQDLLAAPRM